MLEGVMLLWFLLAGTSLLFVAIDIRATPESPVLKWGVRAVDCLHWSSRRVPLVLGCREPLPDCMSVTLRCAGGKRWGRRCTA